MDAETQSTGIKRCARCILSANFPRIKFDEHGVCNFCNKELPHSTSAEQIDIARIEINKLFDKARGKSEYDAIVCYSGGKDSTYTLKVAVEKYKLKVLAFTLDNGFISPTATENIKKVVSKLGVDEITFRPPYDFMKGLFRMCSLETIYNPKTLTRISGNCNACISIVHNTALKYALEKEIPFILAGFTLGQIPANSIYYLDNYEFFRESRASILKKFKEELGDKVANYMEIRDSLLKRSSFTPWDINLLALENITENEIIEQILPLGWVKPEDIDGCSTNCMINAFNNRIHELRYGYSPYELELSHLIRNNLLTRSEALEKINNQPQGLIDEIFNELNITPQQIIPEDLKNSSLVN